MKSKIKVAVVGAGSFVFGPALLAQTRDYGLSEMDLVLMDVNRPMVELMGAVGTRMMREAGMATQVTATTDLAGALDGADFVVCSAAPQMLARHEIDRELIQRHYPASPITEFGGLAGLSYSLRQMAFIRGLAHSITLYCPKAWLLSMSNPLPRVCQAAHESGVRTAGFCDYALAAYPELLALLDLPAEPYPWTAARNRFSVTVGGLNHFSWITELRDKATGDDLMPQLRSALAAGKSAGHPNCEALSREVGYLLIGADDHVASDFLPPVEGQQLEYQLPFHGNDEERQLRLQALESYAKNGGSLEGVLRDPAWEKPMNFVSGVGFGRPVSFPTLNLVNEGQITNLGHNVFVQTACEITDGKVTPQTVTLPEAILPWCSNVADVTACLVKAGQTRDRKVVFEAVEMDPTITNKALGREVANLILEAHADVIGEFH